MRWLLFAGLSAVTLVAGCATSDGTQSKISVPSGISPPAQQLNSPSAAPDTGFTVVASGDVLIHPALTDQATADGGGKRDYRQILAGVKATVSAADLAICHLETPLAPAGGPFKGYPEFSAPPEIIDALKDTGYDDCSTASNHTIDQGADGVKRRGGETHRFGAHRRGGQEALGGRGQRRQGRARFVLLRLQRQKAATGQAVAVQHN
jgi:poly-gamma-glutamate synthesis protein (capsule biosynthesis protein)